MTAQKVTEKIIEDAKKEAEEILAKYENEATQITHDYRQRIAQKKIQIEQEIETSMQTEFLRALSQKRLELNKDLTSYKQKMISELVSKAAAELIGNKEYLPFLKSLIMASGEQEGELLLSNADIKRYGSNIKEFLRQEKSALRIIPDDNMTGGIIIRKEKADCIGSLDIILELLRDEIAIAIAKIV